VQRQRWAGFIGAEGKKEQPQTPSQEALKREMSGISKLQGPGRKEIEESASIGPGKPSKQLCRPNLGGAKETKREEQPGGKRELFFSEGNGHKMWGMWNSRSGWKEGSA